MEYPKGYVRYIFLPENSPAEIGSAALQFIFGDVPVNDQIGTAEIDLTEVSTKCIQPNCPVQPLDVTKLGPGWGEVSFSANPTIVTIGRSTTLSWDGPEDATYAIQYCAPSTGTVTTPDLAYQGIYPGPNQPALVLDYSTVFTLNVTDTVDDVPYVAQNQLTVTVVAEPLPPLITSFTGSIDSSATPWQIELAWTAENAKYCILSTEPSNNAPPNGTFEGPLVPPQSVYTLIAVNEQGQQSPPSTLSLGWALAGDWPGSSSNLIDLAFSSDGSRLYVANNNQVAVFAPTDNVNSPLTNTGLAISTDLIYTSVAVSKDGLLYVASASFDSNGNQTAAQIQVFDASTLSQIGSGVSLASTANVTNMAVWTGSEGSYLFAADTINSNIAVFTITGSSRDPLQAFGSPYGFATLMGVRTSPDGTQIYVLTGFAIDSYQPTGNATSQLQYVASYPLGDQVQQGFGVAPGRNYPAALYDNQSQVTVFDTGSMAIGSPSASIGGQVGGIAIAPDGSGVYVGMFGSVNNGIILAIVPSGFSGGTALSKTDAT